jgi:F-type H+-transporting ATPase subunit b
MNSLLAFALLQEHEAPKAGLMDIKVNLMFWTIILFGILYWVLQRYVYPVILDAVEQREKSLSNAIEQAKADRDAAARLLADHKAHIDGARNEAQKIIAEGRAVAEKMRADLLEKTRTDQQELLDRARRDIGNEREKAITELRREAVDLAIKGAGKVLEENLDSNKNRKLVETFLSSLAASKAS